MQLSLNNYQIQVKTVEAGHEINFELYDDNGYICRLVPGYWGFELSKLDLCMGVEVDARL